MQQTSQGNQGLRGKQGQRMPKSKNFSRPGPCHFHVDNAVGFTTTNKERHARLTEAVGRNISNSVLICRVYSTELFSTRMRVGARTQSKPSVSPKQLSGAVAHRQVAPRKHLYRGQRANSMYPLQPPTGIRDNNIFQSS